MSNKYFFGSCLITILSFVNAFAEQSAMDSLPNTGSIINGLPARCVGLYAGGSRFSDLAVFEKNPMIFYVASANGGVLKTLDGGRYFDFVFDKAGASSIGSIGVDQNDHNVIWVATGDQWQRNSVGWGNGIYKSENSGKTWQYMGLKECISFSKIILHPRNKEIIYAAGLGSPWGGDQNRGVFKTEDGGKTWNKVLFVNETSGVGDLIIDPHNPNNLIAGMWDHVHRPYGRRGGGPGSGIYKSKDGGKTWRRISKGLPQENVGRIGMDYFRADSKRVVAAIEEPLPGSGLYRSYDGGETWNNVPALHTDLKIGWGMNLSTPWSRPYYNQVVRFDPVDDDIIYHGNVGHYSKDGGKSFVGKVNDDHGLWINPKNPTHSIGVADQFIHQQFNRHPKMSDRTVVAVKELTAPLCQIYAIGYDMKKLYSVMGVAQDTRPFIIGTQSIKGFISSSDAMTPPEETGVFEAGRMTADPENWMTIYKLGLDFAFERTDLQTGETINVSPNKGYWPSGYSRNDDYEKYQKLDTAIRMGWNSAFLISPWNSKILYLGANYLFKSIDRGETWSVISPDLTHNKKEWQIPDQSIYPHGGNDNSSSRAYQTIRSISESPILQGVIWVGTDDGCVQLTRDGGKNWKNVTANIKGLPEFTWVSHIYASRFTPGRAYTTFDGHRNCDLNTYVYVTEDYGETWKKITSDLPFNESAYVIKEGLRNPDLLYVGTEFGLYISLDRGQKWNKYQDWITSDPRSPSGYFPTVAVHDLEIHPRELDLIVGTHGRSIWIIPSFPLEQLTQENLKKEVFFIRPNTIYLFQTFQTGSWIYVNQKKLTTKNTQPGTLFSFYLKEDCSNCQVTLSISDASGTKVILGEGSKIPALKISARVGLNTLHWMNNGTINQPGDYKVTLSIKGKEYYQTLHVEDATDEMWPGTHKN